MNGWKLEGKEVVKGGGGAGAGGQVGVEAGTEGKMDGAEDDNNYHRVCRRVIVRIKQQQHGRLFVGISISQ